MYKDLPKNNDGAVAMITVIFIAILLTIITTSFIRLAVNEQRGATDDDLTTRAFYAAESGVQDAILAINESIDTGTAVPHADSCTPAGVIGSELLSDSNGLNTSYTCQLIDMTPSSYQAYLSDNNSVFLRLKSADAATPIESFAIQWHKYGPQGPEGGDGETASARSASDLPREANWGDHPALIRLQIIEVDPDYDGVAGSVSREDIRNHVGFLNPEQGLPAVNEVALPQAIDGAGTPGLFPVDCAYPPTPLDHTGKFFCQLTINGLDAGSDYYLRVSNLYIPTHIEVVGLHAATPVELLGAQAVIDVTGKASDVYRRVEERVDLSRTNILPEFALLTADDICKNFVITDIADSGDPAIVDFDFANPGLTPDTSCAN